MWEHLRSMNSGFLTEIHRFLELQTLLVDELRKAFPTVKDPDFLLDAPKTGCLDTARGLWLFRKHGVGFSFVNAQGVWVDVHREFGSPELFDAWRIERYLVSVGVDEYELDSELSELADKGKLLRFPDRLYQLVKAPQDVTFECGVEELRPTAHPPAERDALVKLVANALYEVRLRLGPGRENGLDPRIAVAARLAYAVHNEALALLGEPYVADVVGALRRIAAIDQDFEGENLCQSFSNALSPQPAYTREAEFGGKFPKRYFKGNADIGFGPGHCYTEFEGEWATRQVEIYERRSFSSLDDDETHGGNLCDQPLSTLDLTKGEEISADEFEAAWKRVIGG